MVVHFTEEILYNRYEGADTTDYSISTVFPFTFNQIAYNHKIHLYLSNLRSSDPEPASLSLQSLQQTLRTDKKIPL